MSPQHFFVFEADWCRYYAFGSHLRLREIRDGARRYDKLLSGHAGRSYDLEPRRLEERRDQMTRSLAGDRSIAGAAALEGKWSKGKNEGGEQGTSACGKNLRSKNPHGREAVAARSDR